MSIFFFFYNSKEIQHFFLFYAKTGSIELGKIQEFNRNGKS